MVTFVDGGVTDESTVTVHADGMKIGPLWFAADERPGEVEKPLASVLINEELRRLGYRPVEDGQIHLVSDGFEFVVERI
jgi:hypothetical protein